jgi:hypothetical protein
MICLRFTEGFAHDLIPVAPDSINPIVDLNHRSPFNIRQAND